MEDLLIVGAGPAGMTAALYAARKGLHPLVVSQDLGGQANWSSSVENYMGFKDIRGSELMQRFEEHLKSQELRYEEGSVRRIYRKDGGIEAECGDGRRFQARAVIVATGKNPKTLNVPGETELRGKGVSYCATCDAPLFRDAAAAVVGGGNAGFQSCLDLLALAREVHLITDLVTADEALRRRVLGHPKLKVHERFKVVEIRGSQAVAGLVMAGPDGGRVELPVEGVFVEIGLDPNSELLGSEVERNEAGEVVVDCTCRTNLPGLFGAGDVTTACGKQIIVAAGEGAKAAMAAAEYLAAQQ